MKLFFFNEAYPGELRALGAATLASFVTWLVILYFLDAQNLLPSYLTGIIWFPLAIVEITLISVVVEWKRRVDRMRSVK